MKKKFGMIQGLAALLVAATAATAQDAPRVRASSSNVRDLQIRGRVQAQAGYVSVSNDEGRDDYSTMELRRVRMGMRGTLFQAVRAQLEANLVPGENLSMRSAFLEWREHKPAYIKLGLDKPRFGHEENTSSAEILTIERSLITGAMAPGAMNGLSLSGEVPILSYAAGMYTDRANRNAAGSSEYLFNASAQIKLDDLLDPVKLRLRADWLNSTDGAGNFGRRFDNAMAASAHLASGRFDLRGEYLAAVRDGNGTSGYYIMPSLQVTDKLQAVVRYEAARSDRATGLTAPGRYARNAGLLEVIPADEAAGTSEINPQRGNAYRAVYAGANYYFAGHSQKLMAGVEVAELGNTVRGKLDMITAYTAWRMLF